MGVQACGIDCNKGREMGCQSYCCRLLVRLTEAERQPTNDGSIAKGFVDKAEDGYCIHFNHENSSCKIWDQRPQICRQYDCNTDYLLQVAITIPFRNIVELVTRANDIDITKENFVHVPHTNI